MPSSTVENYIKHIYIEQQSSPDYFVPMGSLAKSMNVVPGTATTMIKALADSGLVDYAPRTGVRLTAGGEKLALHVLRRHRLVELFLVKMLGLDWSEVHGEAEELEHAISDKVLEKIDALLGYPKSDPHGDPIPTAEGKVKRQRLVRLSDCETGLPVKVTRILDQNPRFLNYAKVHGLIPGQTVVVASRDVEADALKVRKGRSSTTLGAAAASKILVAAGR